MELRTLSRCNSSNRCRCYNRCNRSLVVTGSVVVGWLMNWSGMDICRCCRCLVISLMRGITISIWGCVWNIGYGVYNRCSYIGNGICDYRCNDFHVISRIIIFHFNCFFLSNGRCGFHIHRKSRGNNRFSGNFRYCSRCRCSNRCLG